VRADLTVTMALPKLGCFLGKAINAVGRLSIVDIGIPDEVVGGARSYGSLMTPQGIAHLLPRRERLSHKGTYGRLFVLAGSRGLTGAAAMVADSAMRAGAGLVYLGIPESLNPILEAKCTEAMTVPLPETPALTVSDRSYFDVKARLEQCDALVIGPGLSTHEKTALLVRRILGEVTVPVVVDADGLNCLEGRAEVLRACRAPVIVTPHPGELARLTGMRQNRILAEPWDAARQTAHNNNVICVLKGAHTCIAVPPRMGEQAEVFINILGNAGMASGGVGDVLSGIIGSLLAQGLAPGTAALLGVTLHALAGDIVAAEGDEAALVATDLIQALPEAFRWLKQKRTKRCVDEAVTRCYYDWVPIT
jgi:NAD(P)H-hydrate epimerase